MDKEELKDDIIEEVDDVVELTEEEGEEATGGEGGYGNVQFKCACGYECLNLKKVALHVAQSNHKNVDVFYQKQRGKSSKGTKIGKMKISIENIGGKDGKHIEFKYPNGTWKLIQVKANGKVVDYT